jgi:predicted Zn-dependent peptidase
VRTALLALLLACQDIPDHPDKLQFRPLTFDVPDPATMRSVLSTGTVCYLIEDLALPIVDLSVYVRAGDFWEPRGKEGLADLTGSLMRTGGTDSRAPDALDEELDFLAANLSVSIGETSGSASLSILSKDLDRGLEILFDVLRRPAFRPDKLDTLKAQTMDALKARNDSTAAIESREASLLFYGPDYPLNRHPTAATIASITREDLALFHAENFYPSNFMVVAAGAFKKAELSRKLEAAFKGWPGREPRTLSAPKVTHAPTPGIYCFHKEGANITQGRVTMGHMGVDVHHPDVQTLRVMSYILGAGGFSSRLVQKVRTEEGLAYDVRSDLRPGFLYPWPFKMTFQSKNESCAYAAKLCLEELARLQKDGPSEKELRDAIRFFLDGFPALFFSTRQQTVNTYAQAELLGLPKDYYATYREKIAKIGAADITRVAREHFRPEKFVWTVVGNVDAIKKGDGKHAVSLADLGPITDVPLPDPFTLERPK